MRGIYMYKYEWKRRRVVGVGCAYENGLPAIITPIEVCGIVVNSYNNNRPLLRRRFSIFCNTSGFIVSCTELLLFWKIVLLTLTTCRGVIDLYLSRGSNI